eukprot:3509743-Pyramimonas_sp.AAC.1
MPAPHPPGHRRGQVVGERAGVERSQERPLQAQLAAGRRQGAAVHGRGAGLQELPRVVQRRQARRAQLW